MGNRENSPAIGGLLKKGVDEGVFPGAVLLVVHKDEVVFFEKIGNRALVPDLLPMKKDTPFDLASLTKPLVTTLSIMKLFDRRALHPDQTLRDLLQISIPRDKAGITLRYLLSHSAGFQAWMPFYLELVNKKPQKRKSFLRDRLLKMPLEYTPGKGVIYSDLGFMMLEWVIEKAAGGSLPQYFHEQFLTPLSLEKALFLGKIDMTRKRVEFAATEDCPWRKRILQGEVHDENASVLGGYSGHAGLFGTAQGVYGIAEFLKAHFHGLRDDYLQPKTVKTFFEKQSLVPGSTWALGWDTPSATGSSAGRYFSPDAVGHLGFTGTSLWMDLHHDVLVVFLTNRIHPSRQNTHIRAFRPRLHNLVMEQLRIEQTELK
ncbi:MAG: beta-lactamase family protein [Deltaproteobacteria bacterium]|nr:beta-lactamase family protein [Deltaproteobacteria bacterium]